MFYEYDFIIVYKHEKSHWVANALSKLPNGETTRGGVEDHNTDANLFYMQSKWLVDIINYLKMGFAWPNLSMEE